MKYYWRICLIILYACQNKERIVPDNYSDQSIQIKDVYEDTAFCQVKIFVPIEMDTLLEWEDANCQSTKKYRFTSSQGCLIQESGFFKTKFCQDSFWRITIEFLGRLDFVNIDSALINGYCDGQESRNGEIEWHRKEIIQINGLEFAVIQSLGHDYYAEKVPFEKLVAFTKFNNVHLSLCIECLNQDCGAFSAKANKILESVLIEPVR